jgi:hypothetical protein
MSQVESIISYIKTMPRGKPFSLASLRGKSSYTNCRKVLSRLVQTGQIKRIAQGIYTRPKIVPYIGETMPGANEIIELISKSTGETITMQPAEAAWLLGLTTQVPMKKIFYTTGTTRLIQIGNQQIQLKHISPKKLIKPGTKMGMVILALSYLGRKNVTPDIIRKVQQKISKQEFNALLKQIHQMPAWLASALEASLKR